MNKVVYLREVLGVKNYLCPQSLQNIRQVEGEVPAKVLVVLLEPPSDSEKQLLKKILSSMEFHNYSLLQVKDLSHIKNFILAGLKLAKFVFLFGLDEGELNSRKALFQTSYILKELNGKDSSAIQKKQKLWKQLKVWKENYSS